MESNLLHLISSALLCLHFMIAVISCDEVISGGDESYLKPDPKGYVFFCLCMGRIGNQMEHLLGGMAFAKHIDRTLVIPSPRTYNIIPFTDFFKFEAISKYHRVILAEDFMEYIAPNIWPPEKRVGFCYKGRNNDGCQMKEGNPFGSYWDSFHVEFTSTVFLDLNYMDSSHSWNSKFPVSKYPVLAMKGAPATFPALPSHWSYQKYLVWSDHIIEEGQHYIDANFPDEKFVAIHLRNGVDWVNACKILKEQRRVMPFMASPQCTEGTSHSLSYDLCLPPVDEILRSTREAVVRTNATVVYVATDKNPLTKELTEYLKDLKVRVYHQDPHLPVLDWFVMQQADHFIANCISSFSSFVTRARKYHGDKPTTFFSLS